jgi:hypothetical protein
MANDKVSPQHSKELLKKRAKDVVEELISKLGASNAQRKQLQWEVTALSEKIDELLATQSCSEEHFKARYVLCIHSISGLMVDCREAELTAELTNYYDFVSKLKLNQIRTRDAIK